MIPASLRRRCSAANTSPLNSFSRDDSSELEAGRGLKYLSCQSPPSVVMIPASLRRALYDVRNTRAASPSVVMIPASLRRLPLTSRPVRCSAFSRDDSSELEAERSFCHAFLQHQTFSRDDSSELEAVGWHPSPRNWNQGKAGRGMCRRRDSLPQNCDWRVGAES